MTTLPRIRHLAEHLPAGMTARECTGLALLVLSGLALSLDVPTALAFGIVGLAAIVSFAAPAAAVATIPAALPFVQRPVEIGSLSLSLLEVAILLGTAGVGSDVVRQALRLHSPRPVTDLFIPSPVTAVAVALILAGAYSLTNLADPRFRPDSLRELRWVLIEPFMALALFRWALRRGLGPVLTASLLTGAASMAVVGIVQVATGTGVVEVDGVRRARALYHHPNNLALFLERVAVLAVALALAVPGRRRLLAGIGAVLATGLAATLSRGGALALVSGVAVVLFLLRPQRIGRLVVICGMAGVLLLGLFGTERLVDRGISGSRTSRELVWSASIEMIRDYPFTGVGLDQFLNQYNRRYVEPAGWPERYTSHPHNMVLDFWLRLGIPGLFCLAGLGVLIVGLVRARASRHRALWAGAAGAITAGTIHGLLDNSYFLPDLAVITWLLIAFLEPVHAAEASGQPA